MRLRELVIVLKQSAGVSDGHGGIIREWEPAGNVWATAERPGPQGVSVIDAPDWNILVRKEDGTPSVAPGDRLQFSSKTVALVKENRQEPKTTPYQRGYRTFTANEIKHNG